MVALVVDMAGSEVEVGVQRKGVVETVAGRLGAEATASIASQRGEGRGGAGGKGRERATQRRGREARAEGPRVGGGLSGWITIEPKSLNSHPQRFVTKIC